MVHLVGMLGAGGFVLGVLRWAQIYTAKRREATAKAMQAEEKARAAWIANEAADARRAAEAALLNELVAAQSKPYRDTRQVSLRNRRKRSVRTFISGRTPIMHRSRVCHFVIDVSDLERGVSFWSAALAATEESLPDQSNHIYRRLRLPDSDIRILLQKTSDKKVSKERVHLDVETDDVEAEVQRLEALGAKRWDLQEERDFTFWVLRDPWKNEFCVLGSEFPELLAQRDAWSE